MGSRSSCAFQDGLTVIARRACGRTANQSSGQGPGVLTIRVHDLTADDRGEEPYGGLLDAHLSGQLLLHRGGMMITDTEIKAGKYRGPLHGIPWGGKDQCNDSRVRLMSFGSD